MKATVIYLLDGIVQPEDHKGDHIEVHIHDDPGPHKRGYVRVDPPRALAELVQRAGEHTEVCR